MIPKAGNVPVFALGVRVDGLGFFRTVCRARIHSRSRALAVSPIPACCRASAKIPTGSFS